MECYMCASEMPEDSVFCGECGARLDGKAKCRECGEEISANLKFCNKCGAPQDKGSVVKRAKSAAVNKSVYYQHSYVAPSEMSTVLTGRVKSLIFNITGIVLCVLLFIFSFLPVLKVNMPSVVQASAPTLTRKEAKLVVGYSVIDVLVGLSGLGSDMDTADYQKDIVDEINDRIKSKSKLTEDDIKELKKVWSEVNVFKVGFANDVRDSVRASAVMMFLLAFACLIAMALPLIFLPFFIIGLLKNQISKTAHKGMVWMFLANLLVLTIAGIADMSGIGVGAVLYLSFALAGWIGSYVFSCTALSNKPNIRVLIKRAVSAAVALVVLIVFNSSVISFAYSSNNKLLARDKQGYDGMIGATDIMLNEDAVLTSVEEIGAIINNLSGIAKSERKYFFEQYNSIAQAALSEDMDDMASAVIILTGITPIFVLIGNGLLLAFIAVMLTKLHSNKKGGNGAGVLTASFAILMQVVSFAMLIVLVVMSNKSFNYLDYNIAVKFTAAPIIAMLFSVGLIIFLGVFKDGVNRGRVNDKLPPAYTKPVTPAEAKPVDVM